MHIHLLNRNIHKTYDWLYTVADYLVTEDLNIALEALRAVLHKVRDNLPIENIAHLSDQLPTIIRGIFFERWHPNVTPLKDRTKESFLEDVNQELQGHPELNAEEAIRAVLHTLLIKLSSGEVEKMKKVLPRGVKAFFSEV